MKTSKRAALGLVLTALVVGRVLAAAPTSEAMGSVTDATGNPIVGAVITFVNADDAKAIYDAKTDKKGKYFVSGLFYVPPGNWKVSVKAETFAPSKIKVDSKTQAQVVAKFDANMKSDGSPHLVPIRPFGEARIDFVMIPADQVPIAAPSGSATPAAPSAPAQDPLTQAMQRASEGDLEGSVASFEKAVAEKPDDPERRVEFAKVLYKLDRHGDAEKQARDAARLAPEMPGPNRLLASIYVAEDKYEQAAAAIRRERQLSPQDPAVLGLVAQLAEDMGNVDEAIEANEALVALNPGATQAWLSLGNLYSQKKQADKSEAAFRKVTDLDPANAHQTFYNIGAVIMNRENPSATETKKAVEAFRKAVELKPDYAPAHRELAYALLNLGDLVAARGEIERYLELEPSGSDASQLKDLLKGLPKK